MFNISLTNEHPGLISFRMHWLDLLAVQRTFKRLLQHHSSKAAILRHSAFFIVQHSYPYMTTGKTITVTRWTFVGKVMGLLFFFFFFNFLFYFLTLQYCIGFTIYQHVSTTGIHVFCILNLPPSSPRTIPLGHPSATAQSIQYHALSSSQLSLCFLICCLGWS